MELAKTYDPSQVEAEIYRIWTQHDCFRAIPPQTEVRQRERLERPPFVIMIPLPNVTGALHLGHAINNTLQDVQIRYHRMKGDNTLWQPGTDHAGIATQAVVERRIFETEGKSRHDLGRDELVRRIWEWKDQYQARILGQLKQMGASCDWERTRFTLDDMCAKAVRETFFKMFKDGLIFRGKRLVNWDTQLHTAVADDEVYHETVKTHFWHFKYPVIDPRPGEPEHVIIATTRPETMLGDTAVAVNPDPAGTLDEAEAKLREELKSANAKERAEIEARLERIAERRATHLPLLARLRDMARDGRMINLPLVDRPIPLICDEHADPELGSGCVKITPAHDHNDYEVAQRVSLPLLNVMTPDGRVAKIIEPDGTANAKGDRYAGLTFAKEGRKRVVADLEELGLVDSIEDRQMDLGHSDRSKTPIEPFLSDQWFVRMGDVDGGITLADGTKAPGLAQAAIDAVTTGRVKIFPERYTKSYLDWLGEKRDWCISRQLWWGHRIPVWSRVSTYEEAADLMWSGVHTSVPTSDSAVTAVRENGESYVVGGSPHSYENLIKLRDSVDPEERIAWHVCLRDDDAECDWADHPDDADWDPPRRVSVSAVQWLEKNGFVRDPDVLDTWFSSQLWPFATLGWPDEAKSKELGLDYYYPGSVLITSRDIITLWVVRMVVAGLYCVGDIPFHHVYIHTKLLDGRGETMSKSKGNGVDPVDVIELYGADALRYSICEMATETQDVRMPVDYLCPHCQHLTPQTSVVPKEKRPSDINKVTCHSCKKPFATQWADDALKKELGVAKESSDRFEAGRNFANKLWNAARFAFLNLEGTPYEKIDLAALPPEDRWILAKLSDVVRRTNELLTAYQFSTTIKTLREFFWDSLCDWYIELTKARMGPHESENRLETGATPGSGHSSGVARQILAFALDQMLRLLHPVMPFVTERLWRELNALAPRRGLPGLAEPGASELLILAEFPPAKGWPKLDDADILEVFEDLQAATRGVRDLRSKCNVAPKERVKVTLSAPADHVEALRGDAHIIQRLAGVAELTVTTNATRPPNAATAIVGNVQIIVHDISDDKAEAERLRKQIAETEKQIAASTARLSNKQFAESAPADVVQAARDRLVELQAKAESLTAALSMLE